MVFTIDESDILYIKGFFEQKQIEKRDFIVGFHPSSPWRFKDWPAENFARLGDYLISKYGARIIVLGKTKRDYDVAQHIYCLMQSKVILAVNVFNLRQIVALIDLMNVFVCNSSALSHFAALTSTPTIVLFGSDEMTLWLHKQQIGIKKDVTCSPCRHRRCRRAGHFDQCMNLISVEEVIEAIEQVIKKQCAADGNR
jgi:ADP-heptose:LPS heptosyltransferase